MLNHANAAAARLTLVESAVLKVDAWRVGMRCRTFCNGTVVSALRVQRLNVVLLPAYYVAANG